jgi:hypothetical protein
VLLSNGSLERLCRAALSTGSLYRLSRAALSSGSLYRLSLPALSLPALYNGSLYRLSLTALSNGSLTHCGAAFWQSRMLFRGCHSSTPVPPQLLEMSPTGTCRKINETVIIRLQEEKRCVVLQRPWY